jgi:hypothetical protein
MGKMSRAITWSVAWSVAAALTLLLFALVSLSVLRGAGTPVALATDTPAVTPDLSAAGAEDGTPRPDVVAAPGDGEQPVGAATASLWLSALSAITALIGLAASLWLGWRKERREVAQHLLELERTRLEVEKLRRELKTRVDAEVGESAA